jgi:biotin transport system substrate-specific component
MNPSDSLKMMVYASLLAALTAAGALIVIPVPFSPVPIVLQNLFILLSGLLLGPKWGVAGVGVYLFAGACGLPVFSGGTGGIGKFVGPTGGYLIGFLPAVYVVGVISKKTGGRLVFDIPAMICGTLIIYVLGVSWLVYGYAGKEMGLWKGLGVGMIPFLPGDVLKICAAGIIAKTVRPILQRDPKG